ncbi:hypothetical protein Acr_29g0004970 [Actinidia rufa]|uniref:Retrotransposon Copia-like N-terminal domain-containing protein n=1 Tax=Actinidia rufa TaxID=165716 RepID=A0A7J0HEB7_9ERIC|nr:hypothetical protein Acr_29g0004970 [Actinidia rufa]
MAQPEVSQPISIILDDSNYCLWSSAMQRFLQARKLWKYITGDAQPPHFSKADDNDDTLHIQYQTQLEDWDNFEPTWTYPTDDAAFYAYRDRSRLRHFLMALPPDYEHIRVSLLHRHPLPIVGQALAELRSEEACKKTMVYQHSQPVLVTPVWAPL